ncbi:M56 family metallopeptidase [Planctobacterium marinum]|uniref:Protein TonB n=1 Tax=Planctobacterium marinum TaxID=1631968 RepID=A0AA48HRX3_9ALTE|nr:hypothetical protein MACH26_02440 [Planctobacterium marinum]
MIDWLLMQLPGFSLVLLLLLACYPLAIRYLGAGYYYALWLFVPLQLWITHSRAGSEVFAELGVSRFTVYGQQSFSTLQNTTTPYGSELLMIWLSGVVSLLLLGVWQHRSFMRKLNLQPGNLPVAKIQIPARVKVLSSANLQTPMVSGLLFPKLILPVGFASQPEKMQTLMLRHELVHLARGDLLWNALAVALLTMFWFNPLSWVAYRCFRQSQELACDARVLHKQDNDTRLLYAKSFVSLAQQQQTSTFSSLYFGGKQNIKERILNMRSGKRSLLKLLPLTVMFALALPLSQAISGQSSEKNVYEFKVHPVMRIEPVYPKIAAEQGLEGSVVLKFSVKTDGSVTNAKVIRSTPGAVFDDSAARALAQWRYQAVDTQVDNLLVQLDYVLGDNHKDSLLADLEQINVSPGKLK